MQKINKKEYTKLGFKTKKEAIEFAKQKNIKINIKLKNYTNSFKLNTLTPREQDFLNRLKTEKNKIIDEPVRRVEDFTISKDIVLNNTLTDIHITFNLNISQGTEERDRHIDFKYFNTDLKALKREVYKRLEQWLSGIDETCSARNIRVSNTAYKKVTKESKKILGTFVTRSEKPLDLVNLFGEDIILNDGIDGKCFYDYFLKRYKNKISSKEIEKLYDENVNGVLYNSIISIVTKYKIKCVLFNIDTTILFSNANTDYNKKLPVLYGLLYNEHFYPSLTQKLKVVNKTFKDCSKWFCVDDCNKTFLEFKRKNNKLPLIKNIRINEDSTISITAFIYDDMFYFENNEYNKCLDILKKFGLEDCIKPNTTLKNICDILEKPYIEKNINSFFPFNNIIKNPFNYSISKQQFIKRNIDIDNVVSLDKCYCFPSMLYNLPFLPVINILYDNAYIYDGQDVIEHYFYIVEPLVEISTFKDKNIYSGYHIIKNSNLLNINYKNNDYFKICEYIEATKTENYYKKLVEDVVKHVDKKEAKELLNMHIGKFKQVSKEIDTIENISFNPIEGVTEGFTGVLSGTQQQKKIGRNTTVSSGGQKIYYTKTKTYNDFEINRAPINIMIKEMCDTIVFEMLKSNNIKNEEIIMIKIDNIVFSKKDFDIKKSTFNIYDGSNNIFNCWKYEPFNINKLHVFDSFPNTNTSLSFVNIVNNNTNYLFNNLAGAGKTTFIKNELLTVIKNDYIVLCPTYQSLKDYRVENYRGEVFQKYTMTRRNVEEHVVICDEVGMFDAKAHIMLYKLMRKGHKLFCFGDYTQLPPVNEKPCIGNVYRKMMFKYIDNDTLNVNRRNHFNLECYNFLRFGKINESTLDITYNNNTINIQEIFYEYFEKDYLKADKIICYTNKNVIKYNWEVVKAKKLYNTKKNTFNNLVGQKIRCRYNDINNDLFNNFVYEIKEEDEKYYTLENGYKLLKTKFKPFNINSNFWFDFACTLYGIQGGSVERIFWCADDNRFLNNTSLYTLVSRLKTKNENEYIKPNITIDFT